jgi:4'-phosphopantetheinyl transferase
MTALSAAVIGSRPLATAPQRFVDSAPAGTLEDLHIRGEDVHVWLASLDLPERLVRPLWSLLDDQERRRAARFVRAGDRRKFVVARGTLRRLLGSYLGTNSAEVRIAYSERGKPFLEDAAGTTFNVSHSGELALYAIACGRRVGVDVERLRPELSLEDVARQLFSPAEWAALQRLDGECRRRALLDCWVRKEAYIKARGDGLYFGLDRFTVSLGPAGPAELLAVDEAGEVDRWRLEALVPAAGYVAALAVEGRDWQLSCWKWRHPLDA